MIELRCPACSAPGLEPDGMGKLQCNYCGTVLLGQPSICPSCNWENPEGTEDCLNCGEPLSIVARVLTRQGSVGPPFWIRQLRSRVASLKQEEAIASEQRLEALKAIDRRRMEADAQDYARQRAKDREMILALGAGLLLLLAVVLVIAVFSTR